MLFLHLLKKSQGSTQKPSVKIKGIVGKTTGEKEIN